MALPSTINDREFQSFVELASTGNPARRVVLYDANGNALVTKGSGVMAVVPVRSSDGLDLGVAVAFPTSSPLSASNLLGVSAGMLCQISSASGVQQMEGYRQASIFKNIAAVAITAGTPSTLHTPTSGKKWRFLGGAVSLSVAGSVIFKEAGSEFLRTPLLVAGSPFPLPRIGNGRPATAADATFQLDTTANGSVSGFILLTEE
jgi:hypothetical protein